MHATQKIFARRGPSIKILLEDPEFEKNNFLTRIRVFEKFPFHLLGVTKKFYLMVPKNRKNSLQLPGSENKFSWVAIDDRKISLAIAILEKNFFFFRALHASAGKFQIGWPKPTEKIFCTCAHKLRKNLKKLSTSPWWHRKIFMVTLETAEKFPPSSELPKNFTVRTRHYKINFHLWSVQSRLN